MKKRIAFLAVLALNCCLSASAALAQWSSNGVSPCVGHECEGFLSTLIGDGAGGAVFGRYQPGPPNLHFLQRVTDQGFKSPGWPDGGTDVGTSQTFAAVIVRGELGGYLYASVQFDSEADAFRLFAHLVNADGSYPSGWDANGVVLPSGGVGSVGSLTACSDAIGGYYIAWDRNDAVRADVFLVHLDANAQRVPGWPATGLPLNYGSGNDYPHAIPDGQGGVVVVAENLETTQQHYAYHVRADGSFAWPNLTLLDSRPVGDQIATAISDGQGGAYAVFNFFTSFSQSNLSVQRVTAAGTIPPGWGPNGNVITSVNLYKDAVSAISDGGTGLYVGWIDYRNFGTYYVQHLRADGTRSPGWPVNGIPATASPNLQDNGSMAPDGMGGLYCIIHDANMNRFLLAHLTAAGLPAPGWPAGGLDARPDVPGSNGSSEGVLITSDGNSGAIAAWSNFGVPPVQSVVMLTRVGPSGVVGVDLSLISTQATPQAVTLHWFLNAQVQNYTLQRMPQGGEWTTLATVSPDGTGNLIYEDRTMLAGRRYVYRLMTSGPGAHVASSETWVDVPAAFRFALAGARPNPAPRSGMSVAFSLAQNLPASLEMFDLSGRRVMLKDVGTLGAGDHTLRLGSDAHLSPGIFWLTLTQGGKRSPSPVVVVES